MDDLVAAFETVSGYAILGWMYAGTESNAELEAARMALRKAVDRYAQALMALKALGPRPEGYCFCATANQAMQGHTGECLEARAVIAQSEENTK